MFACTEQGWVCRGCPPEGLFWGKMNYHQPIGAVDVHLFFSPKVFSVLYVQLVSNTFAFPTPASIRQVLKTHHKPQTSHFDIALIHLMQRRIPQQVRYRVGRVNPWRPWHIPVERYVPIWFDRWYIWCWYGWFIPIHPLYLHGWSANICIHLQQAHYSCFLNTTQLCFHPRGIGFDAKFFEHHFFGAAGTVPEGGATC